MQLRKKKQEYRLWRQPK